jgi:predicted DNA-binding transcriptional regulator YafY
MSEAPITPRATNSELTERVSIAAMLRLQGATPSVILSRLVTDYGVSVRQARRYLALANDEIREDGIGPAADPFSETAAMALQRLQLQLLEATPSELPRLISALAKLREVMSNGPSLSDSDLINRAAFEGGLAALGAREGPEPR